MKNLTNLSKLQKTLSINAVFSGLSGITMALGSEPLARFMNIQSPIQLTMTGINLIVFSGFLAWLVRRPAMPRVLVWGVVMSDLAWVLLSVAGLAMLPHQLSTAGFLLVVDVAAIVAGFALAQIFFLTRTSPTSVATQ